jgi:small subunit ribosomal protein S20
MPIKESAKKEMRKAAKHRKFNLARQKAMKDTLKKVRKFIAGNKKEDAKKLIPATYQAIDKAVQRGIIKKNAAARKKSRLMKLINNEAN